MKNEIYPIVTGGCCMNLRGCKKNSNKKLSSFDWLCDLPDTQRDTDYIEVQFKNTRKSYFLNSTHIPLQKGDIVVVESLPGIDVGEVTMTGRLVLLQMRKNNFNPEKMEVRRVYRKAKEVDISKYKKAKEKEQPTMIQARKISEDLKLDMKIGDVEFQGDGTKAIFYYIADERVDFRQLIKVFAETFHVRIEMKQIGARQEAARIGGIGPCGRQLCCSSWMTGFNSVSTTAAKFQDISLNPQKLAGQCSKLKCCMNYELDVYVEALKDFPSREVELETINGTYFHFKTDVFKHLMTYSIDKINAVNLVTIPVERVKDIIEMNKNGEKPLKLLDSEKNQKEQSTEYENIVGQESLTRFDERKNQFNNHKLVKRTNVQQENKSDYVPKNPQHKHHIAVKGHNNFHIRNQNNHYDENS
ncbi:MAG: hypothetical protein FWD66_03105 [Paludibacter sp.]|nr:hypothetical protein [Paludibacter sp.]